MSRHLRNRFNRFRQNQTPSLAVGELQAELLHEASPDLSYLVLTLGSCAIATLGLLSNSAAVIIGAMIIAPLMLPIRGLAFAALAGKLLLLQRALFSITAGTLLSLVLSWGLGVLIGMANFGSEVLARSKPTLLDLGIAVAAGVISGYARIEPRVSGSLAGTAIAVALMPPICVTGLGLAQANWSLSLGATLLYLTNLLGITLACMLTFLVTGYAQLHQGRKALAFTLALTLILLIPLGASFAQLIRQTQLEFSIHQVLVNRTVTFQRVELLSISTNWLTTPPEVRINIRAKQPVTPRQVELLETFLANELGQPLQLVLFVGQVDEIRRPP